MVKIRLVILLFILLAFVPYAQESEKPVVNYRADKSILKDKGAYIELIGNVVFYHNGVFITCDTAYRYSEQYMEGVGNVIINSDSTYIYGDRFTYDSETNIAKVFAPLIKTIDKDAILYTHNMEFNSLENIGTYYGGGTVTQGTNLMESDRGIYYANNRSILLTGAVEMMNENYEIASDSVLYNFDSEIVTFLTLTDIWNQNGEFLRANKGKYETKKQIYDFYEDAYILTEEQELWSDSLVYYSELQNAHLMQNIQMFDSTKRVYMLGDNGKYWGLSKRIMITRDPALIAYNEYGGDSTFMRADTLMMIPMLDPLQKPALDTVITDNHLASDSINSEKPLLQPVIDSTLNDTMVVDSLLNSAIDSLSNDQMQDVKPLTKKELKEKKRAEKLEQQKLKAQERKAKIAEKQKELEIKAKEREAKQAARVEKLAQKHGHHHGHDHDHDHDHITSDSIATDSLKNDIVSVMPEEEEEIILVADSSDYFIYGIRNVKSFKDDMQMVCDSIVVNSLDSTSTLYIMPVVWNLENQVTADSIKLFTQNQQPHKAELYEYPILAQEILKEKYNQIRGKYMEAYFDNNEIDILYVDGNSQSLYYRLEEPDDKEPSAMIDVTAANMIILFDSTEISDIKWFDNYVFDVVPMDKLTSEHSETLEGFKWESELRPTSPLSITTRETKKSMRREMEQLVKPQFLKSEFIEQEKIDLTEQGVWRDRSEDLPIDREQTLRFFINL